MSTNLKVAIQKSGRLQLDSLKILKDCDITLDNSKDQLKAEASNFPLEAFFLRNSDIPQYLKDGVVDIAIIGENVLTEKGKDIEVVEKLGFAKCRLSLAIPQNNTYTSIEDLKGKRIATSYPHTVQSFLDKHKILAELHLINGSVEITPNIGMADAIVDLVSSGSTLFKNNLKEVEVLFHSEAVLAVSPKINTEKKGILKVLHFRLEAVLKARKSAYILFNAPVEKVKELAEVLPVLRSPTVLPLAEKGWCSMHSVINKHEFWKVIDDLKTLDAEGILVCPIEKMIL